MEHALDTLEYAADLRKGGMSPDMAEAAARALAKQIEKSLVGKDDLERLRLQLTAEIKKSRNMTVGVVIAVNSLFFVALQFAA